MSEIIKEYKKLAKQARKVKGTNYVFFKNEQPIIPRATGHLILQK